MNKKIYFFLMCMVCTLVSVAQSPGGVSANLKLWLKSDTGTSSSTNGDSLDYWLYANDGSKGFGAVSTDKPIFLDSVINFQPAVKFSGLQMMSGPTGIDAPIPVGQDDYSVFAVWNSNSSTPGTPQRVWSQRSTSSSNDGVSLWMYNNEYGDQAEISPYTHTTTRPYTTSTWNISQLNLLNQATNDLEIVDDRNLSTGPLVLNTDPSGTDGAGLRNLSDQINRLGARNAPTEEPFFGHVAEVIVYDRPISGAERNQIFSYLALKYGITIKTDLVSSSGSTIWDATANSTYNNQVVGIGRDDSSHLLLTRSNSIETGNGNGTGLSGLGNITLSNPSGLSTDLNFLIVGSDNGSLTESTSNLPAAATGSERLGRQWKVQETGNVGTIDMDVDLTGLTVTGTVAADFRLLVDQDGNGDFTTGSVRYYQPTSLTGNVLNFTGITLNNNEVFAIITQANSATLPVTWKSFTALVTDNNNVTLNWEVNNNDQSKVYEIEQSGDGTNFAKIGEVENNPDIKTYSFTYENVGAGKHYYRILEKDLDGKSIYSKIISVTIQTGGFSVRLLRNPVQNNYADIEINMPEASKAEIEIWSVTGVKVSSLQQTLNTGVNKISISMAHVARGSYLVKVKLKDITRTLQLIKL